MLHLFYKLNFKRNIVVVSSAFRKSNLSEISWKNIYNFKLLFTADFATLNYYRNCCCFYMLQRKTSIFNPYIVSKKILCGCMYTGGNSFSFLILFSFFFIFEGWGRVYENYIYYHINSCQKYKMIDNSPFIPLIRG